MINIKMEESNGIGVDYVADSSVSKNHVKHEMTLDLEPAGRHIYTVDETPTPTRLIRNCEEVGLFEDLKHVNPFDETFRRAYEEKSAEESASENDSTDCRKKPGVLSNHNEDTLHTPHIFPHIYPLDTIKREDSPPKVDLTVKKTETVVKKKITKPKKSPKQKLPTIKPKPIAPVVNQPIVIINYPNTSLDLDCAVVENQTVNAKQRLKSAILKNDSKKTCPSSIQTFMTVPITSPPSVLRPVVKPIPVVKREPTAVQRNNAAAQRYRSRLKETYKCLEKRCEELEARNKELEVENETLKALLSSHGLG